MSVGLPISCDTLLTFIGLLVISSDRQRERTFHVMVANCECNHV